MTRRNLRIAGGACLLALVTAATQTTAAWAQGPAAPALAPKIYTKSNAFDLPILMKDQAQKTLREVVLYVKAPAATWIQQDKALPSATKFSFRAKEDGEYWFNLVTIDNQGRATPPDVVSAPPGLRVVVDTKAPSIDVQAASASDGACFLRCQIQDANPNLKSLRVVVRGSAGDMGVDDKNGMFRIQPEWMATPVRIYASDLAGNTATREVNVKELVTGLKPAALPQSVANATTSNLTPSHSTPTEPVAPPTLVPVSGFEKPATTPTPAPTTPTTAAPVQPIPAQAPPMTSVPAPATQIVPAVTSPVHTAPVATTPAQMPTLPIETPAPATTTVSTSKAPINRRLINSTHASIDYRIEHKGPSGVGKVEVYVTHDEGKTWRRGGEDVDRTTPAEVDLPGEGLFGVRLAITNGNGFGGTPPTPGATPHVWIEVDTTAPFVQLRPGDVVPTSSAYDIRWSASDPNLGSEPVAIYFRTRPEAPWQLIVRNVKNDGSYRWNLPRDAGSQFFFKVEVHDLAGNVARAESTTAVVLDMTEPSASVVGVTGMTRSH